LLDDKQYGVGFIASRGAITLLRGSEPRYGVDILKKVLRSTPRTILFILRIFLSFPRGTVIVTINQDPLLVLTMRLSPSWYQFLVGVFASLGSFLFGYDLGVIAEVIACQSFEAKFAANDTQT
jgi:hypothetical protein